MPKQGTGTVPAPETCKRNGWRGGTLLASSKWKDTRLVRSMDAFEVTLGVRDGHYVHSRLHAVKKFPADVHEVKEPSNG